MTELKISDEGGEEIIILDLGKYKSSNYGKPTEAIVEIHRELPDFQFRNSDILLASYPKTGCTWTYEIVSMLLKGEPVAPTHSKMHVMLEASPAENIASLTSPRLLNTHIPYGRLPPDFHRKKVKVIFIVRNPKDTAVSLYNMMTGMEHYDYSGSFTHWLPLFIRGDFQYESYFKYYCDWEKAYEARKHDILVLYYEEMKQDTRAAVYQISEFLGISTENNIVNSISEKCQFKEMKSRFKFKYAEFKDNAKGFMRKGSVGDWKNWFTVTENEMMDKVIREQMQNSKLKLIYE